MRQSLRTKSKSVAKRELQAREAKLLEGHHIAPVKVNPDIEIFWRKYLEWAEQHKRPSSIEATRISWQHLLDHTGAGRLGDITTEDVESFKHARRKRGNSPVSINDYLRDINAVFNRAIKQGWFTGLNPAGDVERYRVPRTKPEFHSEDDMNELLKAAQERGQATEWTVLLGGWAGLRKMEIVNARWEWFDFDPERPLIHVQAFVGFTIKDHEDRTIPMSRRIYDALYPHRKPEGFLFEARPQSQGKCRYRFDPKKSLEAALKDAGLTTKDPFQRLRRSFGSIHVIKGKSIYHVSQWLGHSSVRVTEQHYTHLGAKAYDKDIDSF